ncbi:MAG: efflux RND transporter periplasmic adaptor subunit [Bryobacterales bacterium]|nr:efflux RND transporter periplasmic adaptor subunit [Bryobacterales bacterium]
MRYITLCCLLLLAACARKEEQKKSADAAAKPEPVAVETVAAETRRTDKAILVTGSLLPDDSVTIVSEVPGRIASIRFDFGQSVRKGDVIAQLDKTEYQLAVDKTRGAVSQALARLGLDPSQIDQKPASTPAVRQATAQMEDARSKYESAQKLVKSGDIAQERFTELEKAFRAREAALEAARDEMRTLLANVETLRADLRLAEKRLRDTTIVAPFDGSISERKAAPGQYVKDNNAIVTLVKIHPMRLRLEVPESASGTIRIGTQLEFTTDAAPDTTFKAVVRELNPALSDQSRTLMAEARLGNSDPRLRPGMFVQVRLLLARDVETTVVPKRAVYTVAGLTKVFTVRDGKLVEHRLSPGQMVGDWMEVPAAEIRSGDTVVVSNLAQLTDGQVVRPRS